MTRGLEKPLPPGDKRDKYDTVIFCTISSGHCVCSGDADLPGHRTNGCTGGSSIDCNVPNDILEHLESGYSS